MRIYLIGMPGSGKTSIGASLSKKIKYKFIDLDKYIEKKQGLTIPKIFEDLGEKAFRDMEEEALKEVLNIDNVVISTGGGIVCRDSNKELMDGTVILINVRIQDLVKRLSLDKNNKRPLFNTKTPSELYSERIEKYHNFKDFEVYNYSVKKCVKKIATKLGVNI